MNWIVYIILIFLGVAAYYYYKYFKKNQEIQKKIKVEELKFFQKWEEFFNQKFEKSIVLDKHIPTRLLHSKYQSAFNKLMQNSNSNLSKISVNQWIVMLDELKEINEIRYKTWVPHLRGIVKRSKFILQENTCFCVDCLTTLEKNEKHSIQWQECPICNQNNYFFADELIGVLDKNKMEICNNQAFVPIWDQQTQLPIPADLSKLMVTKHEKAEWIVHAWLEKMYNERPNVLKNLQIISKTELSQNLKRFITDLGISIS